MSEFVQGLHKLLDRFSAERGPDYVVNKHRRRMLVWRRVVVVTYRGLEVQRGVLDSPGSLVLFIHG